jgi:hypothetical protein
MSIDRASEQSLIVGRGDLVIDKSDGEIVS